MKVQEKQQETGKSRPCWICGDIIEKPPIGGPGAFICQTCQELERPSELGSAVDTSRFSEHELTLMLDENGNFHSLDVDDYGLSIRHRVGLYRLIDTNTNKELLSDKDLFRTLRKWHFWAIEHATCNECHEPLAASEMLGWLSLCDKCYAAGYHSDCEW